MIDTSTCPFCSPAPDAIAFEDKLVRAIWDIHPVSEGHLLLITRRHVTTWLDATEEEQMAVVRAIDRGCELVTDRYGADGYNVGINIGRLAGQTIFHLHVHLIPRYEGDVADPRGGVRHLMPGRGDYPPEDPA